MQIPQGATIAVADGQKFNFFRNKGDVASPELVAITHEAINGDHKGADAGHQSNAGNPDDRTQAEDGFAVGTATLLNTLALEGKITDLIMIAAPRTLGELRKHYHKSLIAVLRGEIAKDLTGHTIADVEKAIEAA